MNIKPIQNLNIEPQFERVTAKLQSLLSLIKEAKEKLQVIELQGISNFHLENK